MQNNKQRNSHLRSQEDQQPNVFPEKRQLHEETASIAL